MPRPILLRTILFAWAWMHAALAAPQHWIVEERGSDEEAVAVITSKEGFPSFEAALASIDPDSEIKYIYLKHFAAMDDLQAEIYAFMEREYPEELRAALRSSGNLHNPEVKALGKALVEAIAASDYVKEIDAVLRGRSLEIGKVSFEKLIILEGEEGPKFFAAVWLAVDSVGY